MMTGRAPAHIASTMNAWNIEVSERHEGQSEAKWLCFSTYKPSFGGCTHKAILGSVSKPSQSCKGERDACSADTPFEFLVHIFEIGSVGDGGCQGDERNCAESSDREPRLVATRLFFIRHASKGGGVLREGVLLNEAKLILWWCRESECQKRVFACIAKRKGNVESTWWAVVTEGRNAFMPS